MPVGFRHDIHKGQCLGILIDLHAGNFAAQDLGEDAGGIVGHCSPSIRHGPLYAGHPYGERVMGGPDKPGHDDKGKRRAGHPFFLNGACCANSKIFSDTAARSASRKSSTARDRPLWMMTWAL